jgi:mannose-6-phosphate isomerase-like protein (cupin superfamily)
MKVRRVTTGHNAQGKAIVASDVTVDGVALTQLPGAEFHRLWGADVPPRFPDDGSPPEGRQYFPPLGGFRFMMFTVAPHSTSRRAAADRQALAAEMEASLPGLASHMEPNSPGMHTTDTIDFEVILSGEVWLELDDGEVVHLKEGDTFVQNGTRHRWFNKGAVPAKIAVVLIGGHPRG